MRIRAPGEQAEPGRAGKSKARYANRKHPWQSRRSCRMHRSKSLLCVLVFDLVTDPFVPVSHGGASERISSTKAAVMIA